MPRAWGKMDSIVPSCSSYRLGLFAEYTNDNQSMIINVILTSRPNRHITYQFNFSRLIPNQCNFCNRKCHRSSAHKPRHKFHGTKHCTGSTGSSHLLSFCYLQTVLHRGSSVVSCCSINLVLSLSSLVFFQLQVCSLLCPLSTFFWFLGFLADCPTPLRFGQWWEFSAC